MTLAIRLTVVRMLLVAPFLLAATAYINSGQWWQGLLTICFFMVAAVTDLLDGGAARILNQESVLGGIMDPIADKILIGAGVLFLSRDTGVYFELQAWFVL